MAHDSTENKPAKQIYLGVKKKIYVIKRGWNTWEFLTIIILVVSLIYITAFYTLPMLTGEQAYTPSQQSYENYDWISDFGYMEVHCTPDDYITPDTVLKCEFNFTSDGEEYDFDPMAQPQRMILLDFNTSPIIYSWYNPDNTFSRYENESVEPIDSGFVRMRKHGLNFSSEEDEYVIHGEFSVYTPSSPGDYFLSIEPADRTVQINSTSTIPPYLRYYHMWYDMYGPPSMDSRYDASYMKVHSESRVAAFRYRELIMPIEELATIGLSLAILRLIIELSSRLKEKVKNEDYYSITRLN